MVTGLKTSNNLLGFFKGLLFGHNSRIFINGGGGVANFVKSFGKLIEWVSNLGEQNWFLSSETFLIN